MPSVELRMIVLPLKNIDFYHTPIFQLSYSVSSGDNYLVKKD